MRLRVSARGAPWLDGALAGLLPAAEHDWLLRACFDPGEAGRHAWQHYRAQIPDPRERLGRDPRARVLAPLLHRSLGRHEPAESAFHTYLRAAYLREVLRSRERQRISGAVLAALADAGVDAVALGETALAETVYDEPALRHSGAVDLLLRDSDVPRALRAAGPLGFTRPEAGRGPGGDVQLLHETGLPLVVRSRLFRARFYGLPEDETWARTQPGAIAGVPVRLLSSADGLTQVCGDVFDGPGFPSLQWVADAWSLIRRSPIIDWGVLLEAASRGRLAVPLAVTLGYLVRSLGAPIPPGVLAALRESAARVDPLARDMALMAARRGSWRGLWRSLSRAPGWTERIAVVGHTLFPSRAYLRLTQRRGEPGPVAYLRRMARHGRGALLASARAGARLASRFPLRAARPSMEPGGGEARSEGGR